MTSRRSFIAAGFAVPAIITLEPSRAAGLHSPPPEPHGQNVEKSSSQSEPAGVLAFTGQPLDKQTATGLAAITAGVVAIWSARENT